MARVGTIGSLAKRAAQQIIGREGETATLLSRCLFTLNLRGGGFAPRQFNRKACQEKKERTSPRGAVMVFVFTSQHPVVCFWGAPL